MKPTPNYLLNPRVPHGTRTRYSYGCKCDMCRMAERNYMRIRRALIAQQNSGKRVYDSEYSLGAQA